jgi:prevent-host-death family protein
VCSFKTQKIRVFLMRFKILTKRNNYSYNNYVITIVTIKRVSMQPIKIGVREAKIQLSKLLEDVQKGREIIITNHGHPVGKIVPVTEESLSLAERISRLERQGLIESRMAKDEHPLPAPLPLPDDLAQKYLQGDRDS